MSYGGISVKFMSNVIKCFNCSEELARDGQDLMLATVPK
jgi:hypothetical protein